MSQNDYNRNSEGLITPAMMTGRSYRTLTLDNKLRVLLVSEPGITMAGASMTVGVGSLTNPPEYPGLAHFLEHMLFLGTEKFPNENSYSDYLSAHGGRSNAWTGPENTCYFFDIKDNSLYGALDIFAQFFIHPLFTESCTEREMKAVDSENSKNLQVDSWRNNQLLHSLVDPDHPLSGFFTGNYETLAKEGIRDALVDFHNKFYSANIMTLTIMGSESLDNLQLWAEELFGPIENKNVTITPVGSEPFKYSIGKCMNVVPVKNTRHLRVYFPINSYHNDYDSNPECYASHLLGHESGGSIFALLKEKGWATNLVAGGHLGKKDYGLFLISVTLTDEGYENWEEIIQIIFQYIQILKNEGVKEWIVNEIKDLNNMKFNTASKLPAYSTVQNYSGNMQRYNEEDYLYGFYRNSSYRPDLINEVIQKLTIDNSIISLSSQNLEEICNMEEPWYGTKYHTFDIPQELKDSIDTENIHPALHLPEPNPYIPTDLEVKSPSEEKKIPELILSTESQDLWFLQDNTYKLPRAIISMEFISPTCYKSPENAVCNVILLKMLKDKLNELSYSAKLAGLRYTLSATSRGFLLKSSGYNQNLSLFHATILSNFVDFELQQERFDILHQKYQEELENTVLDQPYNHAISARNNIIYSPRWSTENRLEALPSVKLEVSKFLLL
eukprot:TRINITY_DN8087_c0_g1_i1.p1 TRINITY_DN8087_c0_g1~~TRINITY_DN8087_c0_g1_i1.p1  ORF type:complete len:682 (+),score=117.87 TRINITY_DN8087_c0_g1_i1:38-2047(+)